MARKPKSGKTEKVDVKVEKNMKWPIIIVGIIAIGILVVSILNITNKTEILTQAYTSLGFTEETQTITMYILIDFLVIVVALSIYVFISKRKVAESCDVGERPALSGFKWVCEPVKTQKTKK